MSVTPPRDGLSADDSRRLEDLLADRALFGLDNAETKELDRLLALAGRADDEALDLAAAAAAVALSKSAPSLPRLLRERLLDDAAEFDPDRAGPDAEGATSPPTRREWPLYTLFAVAAGLLLSFWMGQSPPTAAAARRALLDSGAGVVRVAWAPQKDRSLADLGEGADYGDVVWSDRLQRGFLRFRGLRPNDPSAEQYQLWVFDAERDERYPVDGGVFDVPAAERGEHVVEIDPRVPVAEATLFAVTVEKAGGVVVSDRSRLPLLAKR